MERSLSPGLAPPAGDASGGPLDDFNALVQLHRPRIFRFLLASLRNRETAENLTQDCFVNAYKARHQFRGACTVGTWFMQIAANLVRDHESSTRLKFWRRTLQPAIDLADLRDSLPDRQQSPEMLAVVQEQVAAIWRAVDRLPGRQRTVFLLRFVEDMDLLEIAEVTGMKEGTVKTHLFRALHAVRSKLEETQ